MRNLLYGVIFTFCVVVLTLSGRAVYVAIAEPQKITTTIVGQAPTDALDASIGRFDSLLDAQLVIHDEELRVLLLKLDIDRLLLDAARTPHEFDTGEEAIAFWRELGQLAGRSELLLIGDAERIVQAVPIYFSWLANRGNYTEQSQEVTYRLWGADAYASAINSWWKAVFIIIMTHIDALQQVLDES